MPRNCAKLLVSIGHGFTLTCTRLRTRSANAARGDTVAPARQRNSPLNSELKSSNLSERRQASRMACVISWDRHPTHIVHRSKQNLSGVDPTHDRRLVSTIMTKSRCARRQCATFLLKGEVHQIHVNELHASFDYALSTA